MTFTVCDGGGPWRGQAASENVKHNVNDGDGARLGLGGHANRRWAILALCPGSCAGANGKLPVSSLAFSVP